MTLHRLLLAIAIAAIAARVAWADDQGLREAKLHFERGEKLYALTRFSEAIDEYQKAFDAKPLPDFLYNIGQCYRNLGQYDQAIFSFKKYLRLEPEAEDKDKVEKLIDELEDRKARGEGQKLVQQPPPLQPRPDEPTPIYKKWWFWTGIAVVGVAGGVGIYEGTRPAGPPATTLGVFGAPR
jgi:tetratricopeptide (TPR) repeat protein